MSQLERIYAIDRLLKGRRAVPLGSMVEELEVSRATVVRDLTYMRDRLQAPIVWDRQARGYRLDGPYSLPAMYLSAGEIHALLVLEQLLARTQPAILGEQMAPLRALLSRLLGPAEDLGRRIHILPMAARPVPAHIFQTVSRALLDRKRLRLLYYSRARDRESQRAVSPQRLVHYRDNWYMDAWCHAREGLRSFSLDAIREAELLREPALDIDDARLDRELGSGYGIFSGPETRTARLRFTPEMARWVSRERWHPQQAGRFEPDGAYLLTLPYAGERELVMDLLRFGPDVDVLEPPELRRAVREAHEKAVRRLTP